MKTSFVRGGDAEIVFKGFHLNWRFFIGMLLIFLYKNYVGCGENFSKLIVQVGDKADVESKSFYQFLGTSARGCERLLFSWNVTWVFDQKSC